jgi:beta-phosphoglucomutase-like phosphatase (HAD superfamily)
MNPIFDKYELFVFDLDDTLVKTEKYHYIAWMHILKQELGNEFSITYEEYILKVHSNAGSPVKDYLHDELHIADYEGIISKKNTYFIELIQKCAEHLRLVDGVTEMITAIIESNKQFVIVSNSVKTCVDYMGVLFPILKLSTKNYYREMLKNKKPHPECYLRVVQDFPNKRMIGFEDSITGIHAITQVNEIDVVFINSESYPYYDYIVKNYNLSYKCENYYTFHEIC